jgi:hypothetical protein
LPPWDPLRSLYIVYPGSQAATLARALLTVFTPQPREAGGGAEFQRSRLLLSCHI